MAQQIAVSTSYMGLLIMYKLNAKLRKKRRAKRIWMHEWLRRRDDPEQQRTTMLHLYKEFLTVSFINNHGRGGALGVDILYLSLVSSLNNGPAIPFKITDQVLVKIILYTFHGLKICHTNGTPILVLVCASLIK